MHTMWKGSISFGLVNIPIKMYAATEEKRIRFRYLHQKCQTPIQTVRQCPHCETEVPWKEVVKGYEYVDGKYVVMEKEEMESLLQENIKAIEILDFVDLREIDPIFFQKTYYLGAQEASNKAYALLREALRKTEKIGIAQVTIRSRQSLAVIRVYEDCLVMETIFYPDEVRNTDQVPEIPRDISVSEKELQMAEQLIENLTTEFDPTQYQDTYRKSVEEIIDRKVKGEEVVEVPERQPENVVDLMEALKASVENTSSKKEKKAT